MNIWILAALAFSVLSPIFYTKSMLSGKAKPHKVTRVIVWLASVAGVLGVSQSTNVAGLIFAGIFFLRASYLLALALKYGVGGSTQLDKICLVFGIGALVIYQATGSGLLAICFGVLADLIAYAPTFLKTWKQPASEDGKFFGFEALASFCGILAISEFRADLIFPVYFLLSSVAVLALIYRRHILLFLVTGRK